VVNKEYFKSLSKNFESIAGVREVLIFGNDGVVFAHNIKSFAVKKAVLVFLFHHITGQLARSINQLTPVWYVGRSEEVKMIVGSLTQEVYVSITGDVTIDEEHLRNYFKACADSIAAQ
jgi:hypothetical protein